MPDQILLFPFGGNSREAYDAIESINRIKPTWEIVGFIDDNASLHGEVYCGIKVIGGKEAIKDYPDAKILAVCGNPKTYNQRQAIINNLAIDPSRYTTIIHPSAVIAPGAQIGYNTVIMPNVVISGGVTIGNHCIILPNTTISHDGVIGDCICIGSNVSVSGYVTIKSNCYIGSGTRIRNNIVINEQCLVGLGSNVVSDIEQGAVIAGNPAKTIHEASL